MITKEKIKIFKLYKGEIDSFGHGKKKDRERLSDVEFLFLVRHMQDLQIVERGLASKEFELKLEESIKENFENEEAINLFQNII